MCLIQTKFYLKIFKSFSCNRHNINEYILSHWRPSNNEFTEIIFGEFFLLILWIMNRLKFVSKTPFSVFFFDFSLANSMIHIDSIIGHYGTVGTTESIRRLVFCFAFGQCTPADTTWAPYQRLFTRLYILK